MGLALIGLWAGGLGRLAKYRGDQLCAKQQLFAADHAYRNAEMWGNHSAELSYARARLSRKLSRDEEFLRHLKRAVANGLDDELADREIILAEAERGDVAQLESRMSDWLVAGWDTDEVCLAYVNGCLLKYRLNEAEHVLDVWQADYPDDARPHFLRGRILEHRGDLDGAISQFHRALEKNSRYAAAAYNVARVLVDEQQPAEAIPHYAHCAEHLGDPVPGLVGQAQCHRLLQEYGEAARLLELAQNATSKRTITAFRLVGIPTAEAASALSAERGYLAADRGDHSEAVRRFDEAVASNPNAWRLRYQLAISQRELGQLDESRTNLQRVEATKTALTSLDRLFDRLKQDPHNISARLEIGKTFLDHLSANQGLIWLNSVLDIAPENLAAHRILAEYYETHAGDEPAYAHLAAQHRGHLNGVTSEQIRP